MGIDTLVILLDKSVSLVGVFFGFFFKQKCNVVVSWSSVIVHCKFWALGNYNGHFF